MSRRNAQRALAVVSCVVLLYFAAGTFGHEHKSGSETACSICQTLHMPAMASAPVCLMAETQLGAWRDPLPPRAAPTNSFDLQRASRAPPV